MWNIDFMIDMVHRKNPAVESGKVLETPRAPEEKSVFATLFGRLGRGKSEDNKV